MTLDELLLEWSYRLKKGYPDMGSPSDIQVLREILVENDMPADDIIDELEGKEQEEQEESKKISSSSIIQLIKSMEKDDILKDNHLKFLNQYLNSRPFKEKINNYLSTKNINDKTFSKDEIPAQDQVFQILQDQDQLEKFIKYMENPLKLSDLPPRGNLYNELKNASELNDDSIKKLLHLKGTEGGRGVGKAEIFLSMFFGDCKMRVVGKGDLSWNDEYLEVKGSGARLGGRDVPWKGYRNSILGQLAQEYQYVSTGKLIDITTLINKLAEGEGIDLNKLKEGFKELANEAYGSSNLIDNIINGLSDDDLKSNDKVMKALVTLYYDHYAQAEGAKHFIFTNTATNTNSDGERVMSKNNSKYQIFSTKDIPNLIKNREITFPERPKIGNLYSALLTI